MFATVALLLVAVWLLVLLGQNRRTKNFPPGPQTIPFLGNLLELNLEEPLTDLDRLAKRYGNVYSLFFGPRPAIVLNGVQALKEALVNKAAAFAGRPQDQIFNHIVQMKARAPGVILSDYNSGWKEHRRFGLMTLRNLGLGKRPMEQLILTELQYLINTLERSNGIPINPHLLFHKTTSNVICQILFSKRFDYEDEFLKFFATFFHETSTVINGRWGLIYDSIALVKFLPLPFQRCFKMFESACRRHSEVFAENERTRVLGKPRNFIDCYLDELDKRGDDGSSFSGEQLRACALDLHFAATDTTGSTIQFAFLYLTAYPQIQERCQEEIDKVLDGKDQASFEDREQMPYVQAVVHEIQRAGNLTPLGLFHTVTKDTELMGYTIPRGTMVIPNLSSALNEEGQWKSPHEFNPENFLNERGEFVKPEAFIPFSLGHRTCLGENLARMEVFLTVVTLLRRFKFIWPKDAGEPDFSTFFGSIQTPKPYFMKVTVRERPQE
ncbi:cytochrome P450 2F2-like [Brachionichthys hirsutus]|uniref:cytochrome P450 2F2-like n=1 Tax=Brachionichthys hirsutus TaxID=412623 RepID=UPI0036043558